MATPNIRELKTDTALAEAEKSTREFSNITEAAIAGFNEATEAKRSAERGLIEYTKAKGEAEAKVLMQAEVGSLETQQQVRTIAKSLGGLGQQVSLANALTEATNKLAYETQGLQNIVEEPADGIIDYFKKAFRVDEQTAKVNAARQMRDVIANNMRLIAQSQQQVAAAFNTATENKTEASLQAKREALKAATEIDIKKQELAAAKDNQIEVGTLLNFTSADMKAKQEVAAQALRGEALVNERERMKLSLRDQALRYENLLLQQEQWGLNKRLTEEQLRQVEITKTAIAARAENVAKGAAIIGLPAPELEDVEFTIRQGTRQEKDLLFTYELIGTTGAIGATPAEAAITYSELPYVPSKDRELLDSLQAGFQAQNKKQYKRGQEAQASADFNAYVRTKMEEYAEEITPGDTTNPLQLPPMVELLTVPGIQETKLVKTVPAIQEMKEFDAKAIIMAALPFIANYSISLDDVVQDIELIVKHGMRVRDAEKMFSKVGINVPETYKARLFDPETTVGEYIAAPLVGAGGAIAGYGKHKKSFKTMALGALVGAGGAMLGSATGIDKNTLEGGLVDLANPTEVRYAITKLLAANRSELFAANQENKGTK